MKIGPFEINWRRKTYNELSAMIAREKGVYFDPRTSPTKQLSEYKSWTSSCVSLIKDRVASIPYKFYRKDTGEEINTNIHSYRVFSKPFISPNPLMSFRFIKSFCQIQLDLCGMSMIYKARNQLGQVWELWPLNMNYFMGAYDSGGSVIDSSSNLLQGNVYYVFDINGNRYSFGLDEVILLMYPHPTSLFIGASPIQQQAYAVDTQHYIEVYERDFFANSARVDMVLTTDAQIDQNKAQEIKDRWLEKYRGNYHDVAVLDSGLTPTPMKWTNKDFEFMSLANWTKEMICAAYRVPLAKLGLSGSDNRQNAVYVDINFNRECIAPRLAIWDDELTKEVVSQFDPRIEVRHDDPIPRDRQLEVQEGRIYLAGFPTMTPNEFRKKVHNLPPIKDGGDELYVPSSFVPLSKLEEVINNSTAQAQDPNDTDPTRHDGDEPHANPDESDDRDDNPTPGRSLQFSLEKDVIVESIFRTVWFSSFDKFINSINENVELLNFMEFTKLMCTTTVNSYLSFYKDICSVNCSIEDWVLDFSSKIASDIYKTLNTIEFSDWPEQFDSNPRIAKICNSAIRSCINYSKFLILDFCDCDKRWVINSNECGHKGRIKTFVTKDSFFIGNTRQRFPGELLNFSCDCTISI